MKNDTKGYTAEKDRGQNIHTHTHTHISDNDLSAAVDPSPW